MVAPVPAPAHFLHLFDYNDRATQLLLDALEAVDEANGDGRTAVRLMSHIVRAEEIWLARLEEGDAPHTVWPDDDLASVRQRASASNRAWRAWLERQTTDALAASFDYTTTSGKDFRSVRAEVVTHVINHGTHHRGQVSALLRAMGQAPPATDYIFATRVPR